MLDYINLMMIDIEIPAGYNKGKPLTKAQKNMVQQLDVYFKMKEAECEKVLNKNYEEIKGLQKKLSRMKNAVSIVSLYFRNYRLFHKTLPEEFPHKVSHVEGLRQYIESDIKESHRFIDDFPVCYALYKFWIRCCRCDINVLADFVQNIPGRLEDALIIEQEVRLSSTNRRIV